MPSKQFQESYFGFQWNSNSYDRPWRDSDFLRDVYESDKAPTYQEIANKIGCSINTISNYMPNGAQRGGEGLPYGDIAMFSGGYDSLVSTHYAMEKLGADVVLHIDTMTGIEENQQFVEKVCKYFGWPLEIITPNKTLDEFAIEYGFPKAPAHSWIYRYLKEHPLSRFVTELESDEPHMYTGVRKHESQRRMENVSSESQEEWNGRWVWEAPIAEFTDKDIEEYIIDHGLPRNSVVETIGRSGECFCGAYADRFSEIVTLQEHYPKKYQWIKEVETEVQSEIGSDEDHCYWGTSGMSSDELQNLMDDSVDDVDMIMCVDCEGEGHRDLGHNQDPVYETIYLAGPKELSQSETYRAYAKNYDSTVDWIDPFDLNDYNSDTETRTHSNEIYGKDIDAVRNSDAVLLHRIDGYNLSDASIETAVAVENVGIPVVIFNDSDEPLPLMLEAISAETYDDKRLAVQAVCRLARRSIREKTDETVLVK